MLPTHTHTKQAHSLHVITRDEFFIRGRFYFVLFSPSLSILVYFLCLRSHSCCGRRMRIACGALRIQLVFIDIIQFAVVVAVPVVVVAAGCVFHMPHSKCICNCLLSDNETIRVLRIELSLSLSLSQWPIHFSIVP